MNKNMIADLDQRGRAAGLLIAARFDPSPDALDPETGVPNFNAFPNHRWVRYRSFMAAFETIGRQFTRSRRESDVSAQERGEPELDAMINGEAKEKLGYPALPASRGYYRLSTDGLERLSREMSAATKDNPKATFDVETAAGQPAGATQGGAPRPKLQLVSRPLATNDPRSETAELP